MPKSAYSAVDRVVHRAAAATRGLQVTLSQLEDDVYRNKLPQDGARNPLFITSLPRSGTTLILRLLQSCKEFGAHTYRNMPFLFIPIFWAILSGTFRQEGMARERAHGDGVFVDYDSPEALEEVFWMHFWPHKFSGAEISTWTADDRSADFEAFFMSHMRKICFLAGGKPSAGAVRYLSKNNAAIGRIPYLRSLFPTATILVPFRNPLAHAESMLSQHLHFTELSASDPFTAEYMESIGHFEFGRRLKPLAFPTRENWPLRADPNTMDYWLSYWGQAFEYIVSQAGEVTLFDYDALCLNPKMETRRLARIAGLDPDVALRWMPTIRKRQDSEMRTNEASKTLVERCSALYLRLRGAGFETADIAV